MAAFSRKFSAALQFLEAPSAAFRFLAPVAQSAVYITTLPWVAEHALDDTQRALKTGSRKDITHAADADLMVAGRVVGVAMNAVEVAPQVQAGRAAYATALDTFRAAAPMASPHIGRAVARAAVVSSFFEQSRPVASSSGRASARAAACPRSLKTKPKGSRAAARRLFDKAAAKACRAAGTTARLVSSQTARSVGRFVPGLNYAIAAVDVGLMFARLASPSASWWKKGAAIVMAVGSVIAAANVPGISQAGAGLAALAAVAGTFL